MYEGFLSNFISILSFQPNFIICLFCFQFVTFTPLGFVISLFKLNNCSLRGTFIHSIIF
jgi:hypothetical protein